MLLNRMAWNANFALTWVAKSATKALKGDGLKNPGLTAAWKGGGVEAAVAVKAPKVAKPPMTKEEETEVRDMAKALGRPPLPKNVKDW